MPGKTRKNPHVCPPTVLRPVQRPAVYLPHLEEGGALQDQGEDGQGGPAGAQEEKRGAALHRGEAS